MPLRDLTVLSADVNVKVSSTLRSSWDGPEKITSIRDVMSMAIDSSERTGSMGEIVSEGPFVQKRFPRIVRIFSQR